MPFLAAPQSFIYPQIKELRPADGTGGELQLTCVKASKQTILRCEGPTGEPVILLPSLLRLSRDGEWVPA